MNVLLDNRRSRLGALAAAAAIAAVAAVMWRFLTFTGFSNDHYAHYALAQQLLLGDVPVRDFADPGWPLTYLVSAAAWRVAGDHMLVEWLITTGAFAAAAAFTVVAAFRLSGSITIALLVVAIELVIYPRTYAYPKMLVYAAGTWLMIAAVRRLSTGRIVLMGAAIAAAFLLRHDHGLYLGTAAAAFVAVASRGGGWRSAVRNVAVLTGATLVMLLPWMLFITVNGGLPAYFARAIEYAAAEANASNLRAWPRLTLEAGQPLLGLSRPDRPLVQVVWRDGLTDAERSVLEKRYRLELVRQTEDARWYDIADRSESNLRALAEEPAAAESSGLGRVRRPVWREVLAYLSPLRLAPALHTPANADFWLFWLFWALPCGCALVAVARLMRGAERWPGELAVVAGLCVMAPLVNAGFLRDMLRTRLADAAVPALLLAAWVMGTCWTTRWTRVYVQRAAQALVIVMVILSIAAVRQIGEWPERIDATGISDGLVGVRTRADWVWRLLRMPHRQDVSPPSRVSRALLPFYAYLDRCTTADDRIVVTGEYPDVIALAGRRFASDGVVLGAWYSSAVHQDETVEQMRQRPLLFVVYVDAGAFRRRFPQVEGFFRDNFEPFAELDEEGSGRVPVLVNRGRQPSGVDTVTGWRCYLP